MNTTDAFAALLAVQAETDRLTNADPAAPTPVARATVLPQRTVVTCDECGSVGATAGDAARHTVRTGHPTRVATRSVTTYTLED